MEYRKKDLVEKIKFKKPLLKKFKEAVFDYEMINDGDRILVGFSGGKDSTALALVMKYFQLTSGVNFYFETITINYGMEGESYKKQTDRLEEYDIKTNTFNTNIVELSQTKRNKDSSFCSFISRMRRGKITEFALENNFNKIALGHHLNDAAESLMMGILKNGKIRSLPPIYKNIHNQVIIRPLILSKEKTLTKFTVMNKFNPIGDEMCPGKCLEINKDGMPTARYEMKNLLNGLEKENKEVFNSIERALRNLDKDALLVKEELKYFKKKNWIEKILNKFKK